MSTRGRLFLFWLLALLPVGQQLLASFPEPDVIIFGSVGDANAAAVTATWPGGSAQAEAFGSGLYAVRVPVDDATQVAGGGRPGAARFQQSVEINSFGSPQTQVTLVARGQITRVDIEGGGEQPVDRFRRGDANNDGRADVSDAVFSLNFLFAGTEPPSCPDAADIDDNARIDISDPVRMLNYLFASGPEPNTPGPEVCGFDVNPDQLGPCNADSCPSEEEDAGGGGVRKSVFLSGSPTGADSGSVSPRKEAFDASRGADGELEESQSVLASLEVVPQTVEFGAVEIGAQSVKTVTLRNPAQTEIVLNVLVEETADFSSLHETYTVPAFGELRLGVTFEPSDVGARETILELAPGIEVILQGQGAHASATAEIADVLVPRESWTEEVQVRVPASLNIAAPADSTVSVALRVSAEELYVHGLAVGASVLPLDSVEVDGETEIVSGTFTVSELNGATALVVSALDAQVFAGTTMPLVWEWIEVDGEPLDATFAHGELVIGEALLDLDGDLTVDLATDLVYASRGLQGLPSVAEEMDRVDALEIERRLSALANWGSVTDAPDATLEGDLTLVENQLLGDAVMDELSPLARARLQFLTRAYEPVATPERSPSLDCDDNGRRDIRDVVFLAKYLLGGDVELRSLKPCDSDRSGRLDHADVIRAARTMLRLDDK